MFSVDYVVQEFDYIFLEFYKIKSMFQELSVYYSILNYFFIIVNSNFFKLFFFEVKNCYQLRCRQPKKYENRLPSVAAENKF